MIVDPTAPAHDPKAWDAGHFHVSQIRSYLTCPRQYLFKHVMGIRPEDVAWASLVGSALHATISGWHVRDCAPAVERLVEEYGQDLERRRDAIWNSGRELTGYDGEASFAKAMREGALMLAGYTNDRRNQRPLVRNESRFRVTVQGGKTPYPFAGTIDQVRLEPDRSWHLVDLKTGKTKPQQVLLDLDLQLSVYALACAKGEFERIGDVATTWEPSTTRPAQLSILHLRDYLPYEKDEFAREITTNETEINPATKRRRKKRITNPRWVEGYKKGDLRGPAFYTTQRTAFDLAQAEKDLSRICAAIRFKMFFRRPVQQGACVGFCRYVAECSADRAEPL